MKIKRALCIPLGLLLAVLFPVLASAESASLVEGAQAKCNTDLTLYYPRLFASLFEDERPKASPPLIALPAFSERELRTLKRDFLVRNGYVSPDSNPGADELEFCAPYGLLSVFAWTGSPSEAPDEKGAAIEIAKRFLVENSELTGVTREGDLIVTRTQVREDGTVVVIFAPQTHKGLTVTGTEILVTVLGGKVSTSYLHWVPERVLELPERWIAENAARAAIISVNLKFRGNSGDWFCAEILEKGLGAAELVVTPIEVPGEGLGIVLEWKISVSAGGLKSWMVYVDAVTGAITRTVQLFFT